MWSGCYVVRRSGCRFRAIGGWRMWTLVRVSRTIAIHSPGAREEDTKSEACSHLASVDIGRDAE